MRLKHVLSVSLFAVTCEIQMPGNRSPEDYIEEVCALYGQVDGVRFQPFATDAAISDSLTLCQLLQQKQLDPVFHMKTRERNRLEIQEALIQASSTGVDNILVFAEDHRITGDSLQEMMFFHVDIAKFFSVLDALRKGTDLRGKDLDSEKEFFVGSGVDAGFGGNPPDMQLRELEKLVEQGTAYFLTTPVFDVDLFEKFVKRVAPFGIPIIAEVLMLHSGDWARMLNRVAGLNIPDRLIERIELAPVKFDESAKILLETIARLRDLCAGVHILPFGWEPRKIGRVIREIPRSKFK